MSEFSLPREQKWFEEIGRYDNVEILHTDSDRIYCKVTDDETVMVADVSDSIVDFRDHKHAWLDLGDGMYGSACKHLKIQQTMLGPADIRHTLTERVPCDNCKHALS